MTESKPYARIAITLPQEDLAAADRLAHKKDRSRSWIVAEAVRRYVGAVDSESRGLGASRTNQLHRDMALTPEQRVLLADETLALNERIVDRASRSSKGFATYDEFLDWKRDRDLIL